MVVDDPTAALRARVALLEATNASLQARLAALPMPLEDYRRYGRQMVLEGFGLPAQLALQKASVLVVGAGGLGCPALLYLAGAGIGNITIMDHDRVELSNLHRQVLHTEGRIGIHKAESARVALLERNSRLNIDALNIALTPSSLAELDLAAFAAVLDCTDNVTSRYLLNDACVLAGVPLVSGAAIRTEGQLAIWNLPLSGKEGSQRGPCYRCVFPPPDGGIRSERCEDEGVLGTVTGTIGTLMATETIKLLGGLADQTPSLLLYNCLGDPLFRKVRLRGRRPECTICGDQALREGIRPVIEPSCEVLAGTSDTRMSPRSAMTALTQPETVLVDLRTPAEFSICSLPSAINIPYDQLLKDPKAVLPLPITALTLLVCRRGHDSLLAHRALRAAGINTADIVGGLRGWAREVDEAFPVY